MKDANRAIDAVAKTVAEILEKKKYSIDYYQREYKWQSKQLADLVTDLTTRFLEIYEPNHARKDVAKYPGYYLGSIIISQKGSQPFIVDGQQRLTSLTLFLAYLRRLQLERDDVVDIDELILSVKFGEKSFNLDVPDRNDCMAALFESGEYEPPDDAPESVYTLVDRYAELDERFPEELKETALPYFIDWLKDRVQLVQITAYTDDDAYAIFETMNDRGLKLTSADMLKGYLLANMDDGGPRTKANELWRKRLRVLNEQADDAGSDFLKTWLRSQYAKKIRERKKGARPEDWDRIGTEFHRWLRAEHTAVGLDRSEDFYRFVIRDFDFYSRQYGRILEATTGKFDPDSPLRFIRYNADFGFTLQNQLLLAPLRVEDGQAVIDQKLEIVGRFADILLAWRIWNFRSTAYSTMQYAMFNVMRDIRGCDADALATTLRDYLKKVEETFDSNDDLYVHQQNRGQLHRILARITDYITVESGQASRYIALTNGGKVKYEVEHIWADRPERHKDEFSHEADFARQRNRIGDLLLLPKQFNASYGDGTYKKKLSHYYKENLLASSLNSQSYVKNPGFTRFIKDSGLPFKAYDEFKAADIVERGDLYREIAKLIWNPDDLLAAAAGSA
ncbi:DUF262 domain-containing protein [Mycolicibacter sinensis]|uniref:DUF262 domain-containing protein n=1 Tax=Mycolicibacter sinensis (strain JDM601) TaxID=875328 RepID=A0A1A2EPK7_MYCSD|nr:DUF262 domain-containing protein [Mycolicibacter sinensis]OBG06225.1 hypothetical protein A5771_08685 [Mycolicibacter sinensis]OBG07037.1 hypothetical protein A5772_20405 [Mycolicibacter sinensis]